MVKKFMETDFTFHVINYRENSTYSINLITDNKIEIVYIGIPGARYSNLYTLDYESKTLTEGTSSSRAWIYALVRLLLTLIIEALIFFFFGFRKGKSWTLFIIINLVTQGVLNIWLNTFPSVDYYLIFMLIGAEVFVIIAEMIGFLLFVKEHKKIRRFTYVAVANYISLILGGHLITYMPI